MRVLLAFALWFALPADLSARAEGVAPAPSPAVEEYEIDYEEEAEEAAGGESPETPVKVQPAQKRNLRTKTGGGPAVQGSRAKDRFVPILKSDLKSVYQSNGKAYDVDTD